MIYNGIQAQVHLTMDFFRTLLYGQPLPIRPDDLFLGYIN
jgi:hypothetical protein